MLAFAVLAAFAFTSAPASAHMRAGHAGHIERMVVPHARVLTGGPRVGINLSFGFGTRCWDRYCGYSEWAPTYCYDRWGRAYRCDYPRRWEYRRRYWRR
jgi:hypothetical protein